MASLWRTIRGERNISTIEDYINSFQYNNNTYFPTGTQTTMSGEKVEKAPTDFAGFATMARQNGVVDACLNVRASVFSATRFQWQRLNNGRPSEMFGTPDLAPLEQPWPGGTTQNLLSQMLLDADLCGNSYWTLQSGQLIRLRPDWVDIIVAPREFRGGILGHELAGYLYTEGGLHSGNESIPLLPDEVAHFAPKPDPLARFRGMSWMTPIIRETQNDNLMSGHKRRFFENAATPNLVVRLAREVAPDAFEKFVARMDSTHRGAENAGKTMYLGGGADVTVVGTDFKSMDFSEVQGAGETRIAAAAGVPPIIVGLSEGLKAATYSNYAQARRRFADGTIHPLWQEAAGSLATLIEPAGVPRPTGVRLWYDSRDVPFLREDRRDAAEIQGLQSRTIRALVDAGYTPQSVQRAVDAEDWSLLEHTGLFSVQLQKPGDAQPALPDDSEEVTPDE
jgi:hypothetical protein